MNQHANFQAQQQYVAQQQQHPHPPNQHRQHAQPPFIPHGASIPHQQPYKGTLAPGTRVKVGSLTVTVKRYLSEGGFAHVYLVTTPQPIPMPSSVTGSSSSSSAAHSHGETTHVLKRIAVPDKDALAAVRREVEVHKLLRNQINIVHFIEASATALQDGGYEVFILMEYCVGGGLIDLMNARLRDRLREDEVLKIFSHVCNGVSVMHHLDPPMMHRDLKVENILMAPSTGPDAIPGSKSPSSNLKATFKLCDFGSAAPVLGRKPAKSVEEVKRIEADLNKHTTLQYRAPEMVDVYQRRVIDEKADIWALGVLLYKLCYYTTPFEENGGGPLAILNVQYRIPPQPVYSQKIKHLIDSMLKEQSTDRPTIDQLILDVHKILGTRPPSSAVHYVQQAAAGNYSKPLPTLVDTSLVAQNLDIPKALYHAHLSKPEASLAQADLISIGPSAKETEAAEAQQLEKQKETIVPMRRGRPNRPTTSAAAAPSLLTTVPSPPAESRSLDVHAKPSGQLETTNGSSLPSSIQDLVHKPSLANGFGDSFSPPGSVTLSKTASTPPSRSMPSDSVRLLPAKSSTGNTLLHPSNLPSPATTPVRHSPALASFGVSPIPATSPMPQNSDTTPRSTPVERGTDELSDRFPSVEDLDAQYDTPSPRLPSASSASSLSSHRQTIHIPGLAHRASVGAMAGRFEQVQPSEPRSASTTTAVPSSSVLKRWQPPILSPSPGVESSKPPIAAPKPTRLGSFTKSGNISTDASKSPIKTPMSLSQQPFRHSMPPSRSNEQVTSELSFKAKDWLTGDASEDDEAKAQPNGSTKQQIESKPRIGRQRQLSNSNAHSNGFPDSQSLERAATKTKSRNPPRQVEASDYSSSGDEEEPEEPVARRPVDNSRKPQLTGDTLPQTNATAGPTSQSFASTFKPNDSSKGIVSKPGKLKAPSWLVDATDQLSLNGKTPSLSLETSSPADASVASPVTDSATAEKLDTSAREAERKLEELLRGPGVSSPSESDVTQQQQLQQGQQQGREIIREASPLPLASRVKAPAWDEEDEEEIRTQSKPSLQARISHTRKNVSVTDLVDLSDFPSPNEPAPISVDRLPLSSNPIRSPLNLMDNEPLEPFSVSQPTDAFRFTAPSQRNKVCVDAATSPSQVDPHTETDSAKSGGFVGVEQISTKLAELGPDVQSGHGDFERRFSDSDREPRSTLETVESPSRTEKGQEKSRLDPPSRQSRDEPKIGSDASRYRSSEEVVPQRQQQQQPKPSRLRQRQPSLPDEHGKEHEKEEPASSPSKSSSGVSHQKSSSQDLKQLEPKIIVPKKPTAIRPANSTFGRNATSNVTTIRPSENLKPWEREAKMAAEFAKSGLVRSSTVHKFGVEANESSASADREDDSETSSPKSNEKSERFTGVGSLISKWQQNAESNAPGWGRIGETYSSSKRNGVSAGTGRGLGPKVANEAATAISSMRKGSP